MNFVFVTTNNAHIFGHTPLNFYIYLQLYLCIVAYIEYFIVYNQQKYFANQDYLTCMISNRYKARY